MSLEDIAHIESIFTDANNLMSKILIAIITPSSNYNHLLNEYYEVSNNLIQIELKFQKYFELFINNTSCDDCINEGFNSIVAELNSVTIPVTLLNILSIE